MRLSHSYGQNSVSSNEAETRTRRIPADDQGVSEAASALRSGEVVAYPTETQYGLGVDGLNSGAIERLNSMKGRESGQFLLLVESFEAARELTSEMPAPALVIARSCWPGPVTLLLPARSGLPNEIVSEDGLVAVRISSHEVAQRLPALLRSPLISTSANPTGHRPMNSPSEIEHTFHGDLAIVLDDGILLPGSPSSIVDARKTPLRLVREGAVTANSLARQTGLDVEGGKPLPLILIVCTGNTCRSPMAEGVLKNLFRNRGISGEYDVASAGVAAVNWGWATEDAQATVWEEGIDISAHKPRQITQQMTQEADIILVMNEHHRNRIAIMNPDARDKTFLLRKLSADMKGRITTGLQEVEDPIGRPRSVYRKVLRIMQHELEGNLEAIMHKATERRRRVLKESQDLERPGEAE